MDRNTDLVLKNKEASERSGASFVPKKVQKYLIGDLKKSGKKSQTLTFRVPQYSFERNP